MLLLAAVDPSSHVLFPRMRGSLDRLGQGRDWVGLSTLRPTAPHASFENGEGGREIRNSKIGKKKKQQRKPPLSTERGHHCRSISQPLTDVACPSASNLELSGSARTFPIRSVSARLGAAVSVSPTLHPSKALPYTTFPPSPHRTCRAKRLLPQSRPIGT